MKRLLFAACVAVVAVCANAATTKWSLATTDSKAVYLPDSTTAILSGTFSAYVFCSATADTEATASIVAQDTLINAVVNDTVSSLHKVATLSAVNGVITKTAFTTDDFAAGKSTTLYFAIIDEANDRVFISGVATKTSNATTQQNITINPQTASQAALKDISKGYDGAGWYGAVPEPTSGLMILLGIGMMALRRRS